MWVTSIFAIDLNSSPVKCPGVPLLEEAKLVKPAKDGKAVPDSVLRDIYKDYLLLRNRAL